MVSQVVLTEIEIEDNERSHKTQKGKYRIRIYLKGIFGFTDYQQKATYGLRCNLTLTRNSDNSLLNKAIAINIGKKNINSIEWYMPHYTPSNPQQGLLSKQILSTTPTELQYVGRSLFMKEVSTQNFWNFQLGTQERTNIPIWILIGLQQRDRQFSQKLNKDTFFRPQVTCALCNIGTAKYPVSAVLLNCEDDDYSQGYDQIKEGCRVL